MWTHPGPRSFHAFAAIMAIALVAAACSASTKAAPSRTAATAAPTSAAATTAIAITAAPASATPTTAVASTLAPSPTHDPLAHASATALVTAAPAPPTAATVAPVVTQATVAPTVAPAPATQAAATGPVVVTLTDIAIKLDRTSAPTGAVTFAIKNVGTVIHQLVVLKTDIAQDKIPPDSVQAAKATQPGFITETKDIAPGSSATLSLSLVGGKYVLMCNQLAHYIVGMHTAFTVN